MRRVKTGLALAMATLCVVGCKPVAQQDKKEFLPGIGGPSINSKGVGELYGCDPKQSVTDCDLIKDKTFNPKYFMVQYLDFGNGSNNKDTHGFEARHAYFKIKESKAAINYPNPKELKCAIEWVRLKKKPRSCSIEIIQPKNLDPHPLAKHRRRRASGIYKTLRTNFDGALFGSQQHVYVVLGDKNVKFNERTPISFTPFGAHDFKSDAKPTRDPNNTFFNATVYPISDSSQHDPFKGSNYSGLYYRNYFIDNNGKIIKSDKQEPTTYSMNLNLLLCYELRKKKCKIDEPGHVIPIAIDPDTGNGWGSEP